eukprot:GHVL01012312.1.p1 GENE.GHVL01012312.1~~GHVL01012312.1.p1  ORF type:complete len:337 (-),score=56.08 GHVL01012312.1:66-1025(-)
MGYNLSRNIQSVFRNSSDFKNFNYTGSIRAYPISNRKIVTVKIMKPPYHNIGRVKNLMNVKKKLINKYEIDKIRDVCKLSRYILDLAGKSLKIGLTGDDIDTIVHNETVNQNGYPSPLNYQGFPKSCCISVNEVMCHGIPDMRPFEDGDLVNIDITTYKGSFHGDCCETFKVGTVDQISKDLTRTAYAATMKAISVCGPKVPYKYIGQILNDIAYKNNFKVSPDFCGHGIGEHFHMSPLIVHTPNFSSAKMEIGDCFTIEPIFCAGSTANVRWPDNWTYTTEDGKRTAQFEHTILITEDGHEILTKKNETLTNNWWDVE